MKHILSIGTLLCLIATLCGCSTESLDNLVPSNPGDNTNPTITIPGRPITIHAEAEQQGGGSRTALADGNNVVWSAGDAFSLMVPKVQIEKQWDLCVVVNQKSAGLFVDLGASNKVKTGYIKYDEIKVLAGEEDITNTIVSTSTSSNTYMVGVYNSKSCYQLAPAGTSIQTTVYTYNSEAYAPIIQSSSSSNVTNNPITIYLNGVQYSTDNTNWTKVTSYTTSDQKIQKKYAVTYNQNVKEIIEGNAKFSVEIQNPGETSSDADFTGKYSGEGITHYAVYPYAESNTVDDENITFTLPQTQSYAANTFGQGANPMVGLLQGDGTESNDFRIQFYNVCGVLKLQLYGSQTVKSITVTDKGGKSLCGTATIPCTGVTAASVSAPTVTGSSSVTLDCGDGVQLSADKTNPTLFYIVVPAGAFANGFEVEARDMNGNIGTLSTTKANTIKQNTIKAMPAIELEFVEEFNVENPAAKEYLANTTATLSNTAGSYGKSFFTQSRSYRPDQPNTKTITFTSTTASSATVIMATDKAYSNKVLETTATLTNGTGSYTLRNFVPGNTYYYKVVANGEILTGGCLKATGQLRMIAVDKGFNIRDLGGWTGWGGNKVRYEQIYRGASLGGKDCEGNTESYNYRDANEKTSTSATKYISDITDDDKAELYRIGMRAQLDLRAAANEGLYLNEYSLHSYSRGETTLTGADFNNTMTDNGAYNGDASVVCDVAWIIYELKRGKPVYFNCRQGADRTGTVAFIIEGLLGCYGNDTGRQMAMDYELTGFSQANLVDNWQVADSHRAATEAYDRADKLFYKLLNLSASGKTFSNLQEKCYYYLNQYWSDTQISKSDLDWFINYMLGTTDYTGPSWAKDNADITGYNLKNMAEQKANVVNYAN